MVDRLNIYKLREMKEGLANREAIREAARRKKARGNSGIVNVAEIEEAVLRQRASNVKTLKVTGQPKSVLEHLLLEKEKELREANVQIKLLGEELRRAIAPTEREAKHIKYGSERKDRIATMKEMAESGHEWCERRYQKSRAQFQPNDQDRYTERALEKECKLRESDRLQHDLYVERLNKRWQENHDLIVKLRADESKMHTKSIKERDKLYGESLDERDEIIGEQLDDLQELRVADASGHSGFVDKVALLVKATAGIGRAQVDDMVGTKDDRDSLDVDVMDMLEQIVVSLENLGNDMESLKIHEQDATRRASEMKSFI